MATLPITCGYCGRDVGAEIVADSAGDAVASRDYKPNPNAILWLRCPSCGQGSVRRSNPIGIVPGTSPGRSLKNLPADVDRARAEARSAHSVTAYTAAEIMCRKILMHLAVDKAGAQAGKQFAHYVDELERAGYITTGLKTVVDQIRKRGNIANHELPSSTEQDSLTTLKITEHLLEAIYELPGMGTPATALAATAPKAAVGQATVT